MFRKKLSGQTTMILIVLVIIIFMGLGVFLITSSFQPPSSEYNNLYAHNLLVSVLRRSTGYKSPCANMADVLSCSLFPEKRCEDPYGIEKRCRDIADELTPGLVQGIIKPSFDYYLTIEPENYELIGGERITYGNPDVKKRATQWAANEKLHRYGGEVKLVIAQIR